MLYLHFHSPLHTFSLAIQHKWHRQMTPSKTTYSYHVHSASLTIWRLLKKATVTTTWCIMGQNLKKSSIQLKKTREMNQFSVFTQFYMLLLFWIFLSIIFHFQNASDLISWSFFSMEFLKIFWCTVMWHGLVLNFMAA